MTRRDAVALLCASPLALAQDLDVIPIEVTIPTPPTAVPAGGEYVLVHEVHITNMGNTGDIKLSVVEAGVNGKWAPLKGRLLDAMTRRVGGAQDSAPTLLPPGTRGIVHMFL